MNTGDWEPAISENDCRTCRERQSDGTCEWGFKSGYNAKGEIECQNYNPSPKEPLIEEDPEIEEILGAALVAAKKAFWKSLEDGGWDIPVRYIFSATELSTEDFATTLRTVRIDNIETRPGKVRARSTVRDDDNEASGGMGGSD